MSDTRTRSTRPGRRSPLFILAGLLLLPAAGAEAPGRTFIFSNASRNLDEFRTCAKIASRLKPFGAVQINIGVLADKSWYETPKGGSPWHEYANYVSTPAKFFPHPKIAPHLPAAWVAENRKLLLAKAAVLRELGLQAAFAGKESHMLPESFFQQYPHLRGPRVDHPRRSKVEAFSWCTDLAETREMIEWMTAELKRNVPEIRTILTGTNDAGAGLCWAAALYSGPNGPRHCKHRGAAVRVRELAETVHRGARAGGGDVEIRFVSSNFWRGEEEQILAALPPATFIAGRDPASASTGSLINDAYPVRGLLNPIGVLSAAARFADPRIRTVSINTTSMYARADDTPETLARIVEIVADTLQDSPSGASGRLDRLRRLAARWGGEPNADRIAGAFQRMDEAFRSKQAAARGYSNFYAGVSMRHLTRPLLIRPATLPPGEESYFLPYVFNIREAEARDDYIDLHGGRMTGPASWEDAGLRGALSAAIAAAEVFESLKDAPERRWFESLALGLRVWASEVRSIHNFYFAQLIRDRNRDLLAGPEQVPAKIATWTGHPDYLEWSEIQRDEFDNANELLALTKRGGLSVVARAADARHEDTFVLGADFQGAVQHKIRIMREHWLDAGRWLAPPHK